MSGTATPTLRDLTRESVRARIADVAIDLFAEHGFDQVTVEQVAAAVGISARSFNRYFPTKEDAVVGDATRWGAVVRDAVAARPGDEPTWDSLQAAYTTLLEHGGTRDARQKRVMRVLNSTPSLRARNLEKHLTWARLLAPVIADRLGGNDAHLRADVLVQASLTCFDIALTSWANEDETRSPTQLLAITFATLKP